MKEIVNKYRASENFVTYLQCLQCIHCQQWYVRLYYRMNGFIQRAGMEKQNSQQSLRWADECHKIF